MEEKERVVLLLCQAKGEHSRLGPQELCPAPPSVVTREKLHSQAEVYDKDQGSNSLAFFFLTDLLDHKIVKKYLVLKNPSYQCDLSNDHLILLKR